MNQMNSLTCDDVDVRVEVFCQTDGRAVPLKPVSELLLHSSRTTESVQTHHLACTDTAMTPSAHETITKLHGLQCPGPHLQSSSLYLCNSFLDQQRHWNWWFLFLHKVVQFYPKYIGWGWCVPHWLQTQVFTTLRKSIPHHWYLWEYFCVPECPIFLAETVSDKVVLWAPASHRAVDYGSLRERHPQFECQSHFFVGIIVKVLSKKLYLE